MKSPILYLFFISFLFIACKGQTNNNYETIAPTVFAAKIKETPNPQILDVRTPEEFGNQHLEKAININWNGPDFVEKVAQFDKKKPIFVYCLGGGRSKEASNKLQALGFKTIYEMQGGIMKWNAAGLAKPSDKVIGMTSEAYQKLLQSDKKVLVDFYAEWCAPCKKMAPYLKKMETDLASQVTIIRLNAEEHKTLVAELKINELPTFLLYENKEVKWKHIGFISEDELRKKLQ